MFNQAFMPGATVVGISYNDGVILASEKRVSYGHFIVSHQGKNVFQIKDNVGAACAGMIADMQVLMKEMKIYANLRELEVKKPLSPNSVAKLMGVLMHEKRFFPYLTQVIVGGTEKNGKSSIYVLDPVGSVIPDDYATIGTGAEIAIGIIEQEYSSTMNEETAKILAIKSIHAALQRDSASGDGVDVLIINKDGCKEETNN